MIRKIEKDYDYRIIGNSHPPFLNHLTAFTASVLHMPVAIINLLIQKCKLGESPGHMCSLVITNLDDVSYKHIEASPHLFTNPLIAGESGLKFYASAPIVTKEGLTIGTVCVLDKISRCFPKEQQNILNMLASVINFYSGAAIACH